MLLVQLDFAYDKLPYKFSLIKVNWKSELGLKDGEFMTLLIVTSIFVIAVVNSKVKTLDIFMHVILHEDWDISISEGNVMDIWPFSGLPDGRFIVNPTFIF